MSATPNKVKITYGSNNGRGHYYKGSRIKNNLVSSMPSLPNEKEITNKDSRLKKDVFDFNPDHDDFEIRQLQRQKQRKTFTTGKKLNTVIKHPNTSIIKNKVSMDITSPVKLKKTLGVSIKKSDNVRISQKKGKEEKDKKKDKIIEKGKTKATINLTNEKIENNKRKSTQDNDKLVTSKKTKSLQVNKDKKVNEVKANYKHQRTNTNDSISSLTSLSSLPSLSPSPSPEIIEIPDVVDKENNNNKKIQNSSQVHTELEIVNISSDDEPLNNNIVNRKDKNTIKSINIIKKPKSSDLKLKNNKDDDDDVIIVEDYKPKYLSRSYSAIASYKTPNLKKSISVNEYDRIKRQRTEKLQKQDYLVNSKHNIYDKNSFEISSSNLQNDTMLDLESNNYIMEELEDTFTSSTPKIPRTSNIITNNNIENKALSDISSEEDELNLTSTPSISKSYSLSILPESRVKRMKSSHLKKSKSLGNIYDSSTSLNFNYQDDENSSSTLISRMKSKSGNENDKDNDDDVNSLKRSYSAQSQFSDTDNKKNDKVINSEIKLLDGSSINVPILFFKKKKKRIGHDGDATAVLTGVDEGENKNNHFYRKTYQNVGSLVKNDDPYDGPYVAMSKMFDDSESEEEDLDSSNKNKKIKSLFELKELGENKKFKDEIDYLLDGLSEKQTTTAKRLSCIDLCKKLSESDFILNLRAYGYISQIYKILSNEKDKIIQLCLIYFIYTLFQDEGSLDIIIQENDCLPLLIKFLRIKDEYISIEKLKNTKEKICMKEIRKVMEESEHFENMTISFQLISMKCLIQLIDPSSSVDIKNDLKEMLFTNNFGNDKILSSPSIASSLTCIDILTNRLKTYTNYFEKTYQQWKSEVESQKKNIPFPFDYEHLENINTSLKLFELLNKENDLELSLIVKSKISSLIIQLLHHYLTIIYNDHDVIDEAGSQFLLNSIRVLINFFNEAKEAEFHASIHSENNPQNSILTEEQYIELFKVLLVYIDQFSPLLEENKKTKLQDIFLLIIGLLINATEHNEKCRFLIAQLYLGKSCSYNPKIKKNKWMPCRFGCHCSEEESRSFLEIIVENYSNIVKTENYILASYLAILIGFLCLHPENKVNIKKYLYENSFSTIIQILEQFIQLNTLSQEFASPSLGFNPSALINGGGNSDHDNGNGSLISPLGQSMLDFSSFSFPMDNLDSGLDLGLINGNGMTPLSLKKDRKQDNDSTTESFLKVIKVLKQE